MKSPLACDVCNGFGLLFARIPLGTALAVAGYHKIHDIGVKQFVQSSISSVPAYMPGWFAKPYLTCVPWAEATFGVLIVLGLLTRVSGLLSGAMLISFALAVNGIFNPDFNPLPLTNP